MSNVEGADWIYELDSHNPNGTDLISEGDDHLRLIKKVMKDSFPSVSDEPQIPNISGNAGKMLVVNDTGTATEWVNKQSLTWVRLVAVDTQVPIDTWTPLGMAYTILETGPYSVSYGINKFGTGAFDFKENGMALTVDNVKQGETFQYTSNKTASWNFLASSNILILEKDSVIGMQAYQDNGPNTTITIGPSAYINMVKIG